MLELGYPKFQRTVSYVELCHRFDEQRVLHFSSIRKPQEIRYHVKLEATYDLLQHLF